MSIRLSRRWLVILLIIAIAIGITASLLWRQKGNRLDVARLVSLKNKAIGLAENAEYAEAEELLKELAKVIPDEPLVLRNLAIARIGPLESLSEADLGGPQKKSAPVTPQQVLDAVAKLVRAAPDDPVTHILQARAARQLLRIDPEAAAKLPDPLKSLQTAAKLGPENAAVRFELHELVKEARYQRNEEAQQAGREAIAEAYRLQPRNLTLFLQLIVTQAEAQDPALAATLQSGQELLAPLAPLVARVHRVDLEQARQEAIQAVQDGNWGAVRRIVRPQIFNLLNNKTVQQTDRLRISVGALEYLRHDFSDEFYEKHGRPPAPEFPETNVRFTAVQAAFPQWTDIRDLRLVDANLDAKLDLAVLHGSKLSILTQAGGNRSWETLLEADVPTGMQRILAADLDRDIARLHVEVKEAPRAAASGGYRLLQSCEQAFPDFLLYGEGGIAIVRNERKSAAPTAEPPGQPLRKLTVVELALELSGIGNVTAAVLVDFDHDQDLDLILGVEGKGVRLWRMLGNATFKFEDFSQWSSLPADTGSIADLAIVDWSRDLYTDVIVCPAGDGALPLLLANQRHGQFLAQPLALEFAPLAGARAVAPIELDGNVSWDLAGLSERGIEAVLTTTPAPGEVSFLRALPAAKAKAARLLACDFDNDTYPDLLAFGSGAAILRGTPKGFVPVGSESVAGLPDSGVVTMDYGDLDGDHDLDLIAATANQIVQLGNDGGNAKHSLLFYVTGAFNGQNVGANNSAIGTVVETRTPGRYQAQVVTRQPVHVGLGTASKADLVRLIFTNGIPRSAAGDTVKEIFCEKQILHGSCPFIYCWTGEKYEFFSDCLWAAPIGLQVAEGKMAPSRAWEYLLIPGERLKQRGGTYDLQITEELWEAAYFDEVKLIAVDHPAGTDLYTNEKVGGPDIAAPKLHLVKEPRRPIAARDKHGRDVLATVSQRDDRYLRGFDQHIKQGLVDEHFLELDLGQLAGPKQITLFLTGWIYPTNTSINVNLSQHPDLEYPRLPYVQVADGQGGWQEVQAFMGFPGGKTKTIAVELPGDVFEAGQYKLRICTSAEIYWDDVFFTVDEAPIVGRAPKSVKEHPLELVSADLHFRGWSAEVPHHPHSPLRFDYQSVSTEPKWPPMGGNFTRFGDVAPLLAKADDEMVVMGSGDEMTIRFRVPAEEPPAGWKRDFILYSVGWDKDADLNTVYGQTAEPLPYNAMPTYPYPPDQWYPDTPATRRYLEAYQTRRQDHRRFWRYLAQ